MTFRLTQSATFEWPVRWKIPGDGKLVECSFTAVFRRLDLDELKRVFTNEAGEARADAEIAADVLVGWRHVVGEDNQALEYSDTARDQLMRVVGAQPAVVQAFVEAMRGGLDRKN